MIDIYSRNNECYAITIELCTTCNWKCLHCYLPEHNCVGFSTERVEMLLEEMRVLGVYALTLTGGEIFTRKDCMHLIEYARHLGLAVHLLSNASLLTESDIDKLSQLNIDGFDCTIFSMDDEIHDTFVQTKGALSKALENVLRLKNAGINVKVKCILTKYNWFCYKEIKQFCNDNNIESLFTVCLYKRHNGDDAPLEMQVPTEHLDEIIRETTPDDGYCYKGITSEGYICHSPHYSMFVDVHGNVHPCGNHPRIIGNINKQSLFDIWNGSEFRALKNVKIKDTFECGNCRLKERCFTCAGINELEGYSIYGHRKIDCYLAELREKYFA